MATTDAGESRAWELLAACDPIAVSERAAAAFDAASGNYKLAAFGRRFLVHPGDRRILHLEPEGEVFLGRHAGFFRLSMLWYLVRASSALPSGRLVNPAGLPGGDIFLKGTHVLPLDALAAKYATDPEALLGDGAALGGRTVAYGDAAVELPALPKVPATVILWTANDEFPARASLLFDATCAAHLPPDVLWSVAMTSIQALLCHECFAESL